MSPQSIAIEAITSYISANQSQKGDVIQMEAIFHITLTVLLPPGFDRVTVYWFGESDAARGRPEIPVRKDASGIWSRFNTTTVYLGIGISIIKMRRSYNSHVYSGNSCTGKTASSYWDDYCIFKISQKFVPSVHIYIIPDLIQMIITYDTPLSEPMMS